MKMEIERRFLVDIRGDELDALVKNFSALLVIEQGYMCKEGPTVRVRVQQGTVNDPDENVGWITIKGQATKNGKPEFEYEIYYADARQLLKLAQAQINKTRYIIDRGVDNVIELDCFTGDLSGLVIAEVEFSSAEEAEAYFPPPWFSTELTGLKGWSNKSLAFKGLPKGSKFKKLSGGVTVSLK